MHIATASIRSHFASSHSSEAMASSRERTPPPAQAFHPPSAVAKRLMAAYRAAEGKSKGKGTNSAANAEEYVRNKKARGSQDSDIAGNSDGDRQPMQALETWTKMQTHMLQQQIKMQQQQMAHFQEQLDQQGKLTSMAMDWLILLLSLRARTASTSHAQCSRAPLE